MILIGQYDSPFVRRVAIAATLYGVTFEHRPWSVFGDGDKIAPLNPLRRVPTAILSDGSVVIESAYILDWLDEQAGSKSMIAASGPDRRKALYYIALSMGLSDKVVAMFYEIVLHKTQSEVWRERCQTQIKAVLDHLEQIRTEARGGWLFGPALSHADIALGCALTHARESMAEAAPGFIDWAQWPALSFHSAQCEQMEVFKTIYQKFRGPNDS